MDNIVGKIHRGLGAKTKQQFSLTVRLMIKKAVNDATFAKYTKLLDETGYEVVKNGLTPELLEALLAN